MFSDETDQGEMVEEYAFMSVITLMRQLSLSLTRLLDLRKSGLLLVIANKYIMWLVVIIRQHPDIVQKI